MHKSKSTFPLTFVASALILAGCGGDDDGGYTQPTNPDVTTPVLAMDGFSVVVPNEESFIDLSQFVRGTDVRIADITANEDNPHCGQPSVSGTGVNVEITEGTFCEYSYTATQTGLPSATATLNVLATKASNPMLPPLSEAMVLGGAPVRLNLVSLLGSDWKSTYSLNAASVQVQGMEGNLGTETAAGNVITFTAPELSGWNRIIYTLTDSAASGEDVMGEIYVTISEEVNEPPRISSVKYSFNANNSAVKVVAGRPITINLANLGNFSITEPDSQEWQLVNVSSFTATTTATNASSVTNKSFTFTAPSVGAHYVNYIVADHYGGYSVGQMEINAEANEKATTWEDVQHDGTLYHAPLRYTEALGLGLRVRPIWDEKVSNTLAGYYHGSARIVCSAQGMQLPTHAQFQKLRQSTNDKLDVWPKGKNYIVKADTKPDAQATLYATGFPHSNAWGPIDNGDYYITCVTQAGTMSFRMLKTTIDADGTTNTVAEVTMPGTDDTFTITKNSGTLSSSQANVRKGSTSGRVTEIYASGRDGGTYSFRVTDDNDPNSYKISSLITYEKEEYGFDNSSGSSQDIFPGDSSHVTLRTRVVDNDGRAAPNQPVRWWVDSGPGVLHEAQSTSDGAGYVTANLKASGTGTIKVNISHAEHPSETGGVFEWTNIARNPDVEVGIVAEHFYFDIEMHPSLSPSSILAKYLIGEHEFTGQYTVPGEPIIDTELVATRQIPTAPGEDIAVCHAVGRGTFAAAEWNALAGATPDYMRLIGADCIDRIIKETGTTPGAFNILHSENRVGSGYFLTEMRCDTPDRIAAATLPRGVPCATGFPSHPFDVGFMNSAPEVDEVVQVVTYEVTVSPGGTAAETAMVRRNPNAKPVSLRNWLDSCATDVTTTPYHSGGYTRVTFRPASSCGYAATTNGEGWSRAKLDSAFAAIVGPYGNVLQ